MKKHCSGFLEIYETDLFILGTSRMLPTPPNESRHCEPVHLLKSAPQPDRLGTHFARADHWRRRMTDMSSAR